MDQIKTSEVPPIDAEVIQLALNNAASRYDCERCKCPCGRGAAEIADINELLDEHGIDATNARAFAHGAIAIMAAFAPAVDHINIADAKTAALLIVEALRRAGDVTDADITVAVERFNDLLSGNGATFAPLAEPLRMSAGASAPAATAPGSSRMDN